MTGGKRRQKTNGIAEYDRATKHKIDWEAEYFGIRCAHWRKEN